MTCYTLKKLPLQLSTFSSSSSEMSYQNTFDSQGKGQAIIYVYELGLG